MRIDEYYYDHNNKDFCIFNNNNIKYYLKCSRRMLIIFKRYNVFLSVRRVDEREILYVREYITL